MFPMKKNNFKQYSHINFIFFSLFIFMLLSGVTNAQSQKYVENELIVKWKSTTSNQEKSKLFQEWNAISTEKISKSGIEVFTVKKQPDCTLEQLIESYQNHPNIAFVEPNYIYHVNTVEVPNDPLYVDQWHLNNIAQTGGEIDADIDAPEAWTDARNASSVVVAILDTGIDWKHEDLVDNVWQNLAEDADGDGQVLEWDGTQWIFDPDDENGIDDDNNGYADDFIGWDFANNDNNPYDDHDGGHGTHVAGIIGASGNNHKGVAGVCWDVQLAALKFIAGDGGGTSVDAIKALDYAINMGIPISNNSWGNYDYSTALYNAVESAKNANHLFIAAAGNNNLNAEIDPMFPASFDLDNIISVAATDHEDKKSSFSNYGTVDVDLAAPGSEIKSCIPNNLYANKSGTSMAAPLVAGTAALINAISPFMDYEDTKSAILSTVDVKNNLIDKTLTGGRLNLKKAISSLDGTSCRLNDSLVLVKLFHTTSGPNWNKPWVLTDPLHTWQGVIINRNGCVVTLNMQGSNLSGTLPSVLGNLNQLRVLNLNNNQLSGSIPSELGNLLKLTNLQLAGNELTGSIPISLGNLSSLRTLYLNENALSGSIPNEIGNLSKLASLRLHMNQLTGSIPSEIGNLGELQQLYLQDNQLSGFIPPTITGLSKLSYLNVMNNDLGGAIPETLDGLENLTYFNASNNQLGGTLPESIAALSKLTSLILSNNQIGGFIPAFSSTTTTTISKLHTLYLNNNKLSGCFPASLSFLCHTGINIDFTGNPNLANEGNFTAFCTMDAGVCTPCAKGDSLALVELYNKLDGKNWSNPWDLSLPMETYAGVKLSDERCVTAIYLPDNNLSGVIPPAIGDFARLRVLDLSDNEITKGLPKELYQLTSLTDLNLSQNNLLGAILPDIEKLSYLTNLDLSGNELSGAIPSEIGSIHNLSSLKLSDNNFTDAIPSTLGNIPYLRELYLGNNQLKSTIPSSLGNLSYLEFLAIGHNHLKLSIPKELSNLSNLRYLDLSNNDLLGSIPTELGQLSSLKGLQLNNNDLSGSIPKELGNINPLSILNLSYNNLSSTLPKELGALYNLSSLDLSHNNLSGAIPIELSFLNNLGTLNLASNQLSGCFPTELDVFCTNTTVSFLNNPDLPNGGDFKPFCDSGDGACPEGLVYPGDLNNDGIANHIDALYWGLVDGNTGTARQNASTDWTGQFSTDWAGELHGVNYKYQDANGDGIVNDLDVDVIEANYGSIHGIILNNRLTGTTNYRLEPIGMLASMSQSFDLYLNDSDIPALAHGIALTLDLSTIPVEEVLIDIDNSSLEPEEVVSHFDPTTNQLELALTRNDNQNVLCSGPVVRLNIVIDDEIPLDTLEMNLGGATMLANATINDVGNSSYTTPYSEIGPSSDNMILGISSVHVQPTSLGSAEVFISGGESPYTMEWNTGATTAAINELTPGWYTVTVNDSNGLTKEQSVLIRGYFLLGSDANPNDNDSSTCPYTIDLPHTALDGLYKAERFIQSNGVVNPSKNVELKAGESILLQPGFEVKENATFSTEIEECGSQ